MFAEVVGRKCLGDIGNIRKKGETVESIILSNYNMSAVFHFLKYDACDKTNLALLNKNLNDFTEALLASLHIRLCIDHIFEIKNRDLLVSGALLCYILVHQML